MVDYISLTGEIIAAIAAFFTAIVIIKRDPKYRGNQLFALSFCFFFLYASSIMVYDLEFSLQISFISYNFSMMLISFALSFFVSAMQVFIKSTTFLKEKTFYLLLIGSTIIGILFIIFPNQITAIPVAENNEENLLSLIPLGIWQLSILTYNMVTITKALRKISPEKKAIKNKIKNLWIANGIGLLCPAAEIIASFTGLTILSSLVNIFIAISMVWVGFTVRKKTD
ncbi:MAG: hypothetical protein GY870_00670 [archaeon]|nr:hypothetical protein [archaeon]